SPSSIDLGAVVHRDKVEYALDVAVREVLTSLPYLRWRLSRPRGSGRRGAGVIAQAGWQVLRFTTDLGASDLGDPDHCSRSHGG
ncbi:MAG TPA: hypothetical protein VIL12_06170, partial [Acidimicrobiia bacterium]